MRGPVIWVEGIIGAGKSTFARALANAMFLRLVEEPVGDNPYLALSYEDPKRWAWPMQIELLHRRYAMQKLAAFESTTEGGYEGAVLDRGMPGDRVFARMHHEAGNFSDLEWETYLRAYDVMACSLVPPSLMVFLRVSPEVAMGRVQKRARGAESSLTMDYLEDLAEGYERMLEEVSRDRHPWARGMQVLVVDWNRDRDTVADLVRDVKSLLVG